MNIQRCKRAGFVSGLYILSFCYFLAYYTRAVTS